MKTLIKGAIVALALAGAGVASASAATSFGFVIGPDGARVAVEQGSYYDRYHHRHYYRYPREWSRFGHDRGWYRDHPRWDRDHDWYR
ncbi:MAG TPA: hypothetical protein VNH44_19495 [Micropepsaceae bacterium]|nr:hypothetical protein [Micropepsaceae bacterium]